MDIFQESMKKFLAIAIFLLGAASVYAQEVDQNLQVQSEQEIIRGLREQVENLNRQNSGLIKQNTSLERKVEKANIRSLEASLEGQKISIDSLKSIIKAKDSTVVANRVAGDLFAEQRYIDGRRSILEQIGQTYRSGAFDNLAASSIPFFVDRDSELLKEYQDSTIMLAGLNRFLYAKQVLRQKYDERLVANAIDSLNSIAYLSEVVDKLRTTLEDYQI